jgi:hypothetical protein
LALGQRVPLLVELKKVSLGIVVVV